MAARDLERGLRFFYHPGSVAVVGASRDAGKMGHEILENLRTHFRGRIYPVNPRENELAGLPCYPSLDSIPGEVQMMVIAIPARGVPGVFHQAASRGDVRTAVVTTAGFGEMGDKASGVLQEEIMNLARRAGIRVLGPNSVGVVYPAGGINTTFATHLPMRPGTVGLITQSGSLGGTLLLEDEADPAPLGIAKWTHLGNMADVDYAEVLDYYGRDDEVQVIAVHLEGLRDGRTFLETVARVNRVKPVVVLKVGRNEAGSGAAASHTGNLAGSDRVWEGALRQAGVIRVATMRELLETCRALSRQPLPPGRRICVLTEAGGPGILAMDEVGSSARAVPAPISERGKARLQALLPAMAAVSRPQGYVDMSGSATEEQQGAALREVLEDPGVDGVLLVTALPSFLDPPLLAEKLAAASTRTKPVLTCLLAGERALLARRILEERGLPTFSAPEGAARAMLHLVERWQWLEEMKSVEAWAGEPRGGEARCGDPQGIVIGARVVQLPPRGEGGVVTEPAARGFLEQLDFPVGPYVLAASVREAVEAANRLGYPVVLKVVSPDIVHKTEAGGVKLGLRNPAEVEEAFREIVTVARAYRPGLLLEGVQVTRMAPPGTEFIVGALRDPQFGPVVMFGLGGIWVEVIEEVSFGVAPLCRQEALTLLRSNRAHRLLQGVRGRPPADLDPLIDLLVRTSELMLAYPAIREIEFNPVIVHSRGLTLADARLLLA